MTSDLLRVPRRRKWSSLMKAYFSGAPAHFISVAGRLNTATPPLSANSDSAPQVALAAWGLW